MREWFSEYVIQEEYRHFIRYCVPKQDNSLSDTANYKEKSEQIIKSEQQED